MSPAEIIRTAPAAGVTLAVRGNWLSVIPAAQLSPVLRVLLIANKVELLAFLRQSANDPSAPRNRTWRIRFNDGARCTAVNTTGADAAEMLEIERDQFGRNRVMGVESDS